MIDQKTERDAGAASGPKTILLVTGVEHLLHPQLAFLSRSPFRIRFAGSSREAISIIRSARPDLVLMDLLTPGTSLLQVCQKVREGSGDAPPPIVVLGSSAHLSIAEPFFAAGCSAFLVRPFQQSDFLCVVEDLLNLPHSHDGRVWTDLPCTVRAIPEPLLADAFPDSTRILRLGMAGAFVGMDMAHAGYGGVLEITVTLPEWRNKVKLRGTVSWSGYLQRRKTLGAGIRFFPLQAIEEELLRRHIQAHVNNTSQRGA